jgi:hypothetical protein
MKTPYRPRDEMTAGPRYAPAAPLWQLAPTRGEDGGGMADFMMLIPGLARRPAWCQARVADLVREVCAGYGRQVAFADINFSIGVLWVSVAAEPGLTGQVAQAIRQRVPEALLVGGQLGAVPAVPVAATRFAGWRRRVRCLKRVAGRLLPGPRGSP